MISKSIDKLCKHINLIENYEKALKDKTKTWHCHHRLEDLGFSKSDLIYIHLYFNVPPDELIFMKPADHIKHHKIRKQNGTCDKHLSEETRKKISKANKGKSHNHSEETKKKLKISSIGKHYRDKHPKYLKICPLLLYTQYNVFNKSLKECANIFNCKTGTISKKLRDFNLPKKNKHERGKIIQYDLNGNFIAEFKSANEVERKLGIAQTIICKICNGKMKQYNNYTFVRQK